MHDAHLDGEERIEGGGWKDQSEGLAGYWAAAAAEVAPNPPSASHLQGRGRQRVGFAHPEPQRGMGHGNGGARAEEGRAGRPRAERHKHCVADSERVADAVRNGLDQLLKV